MTFYNLVTGVVPFTGSNDLEVIEKKGKGDFRPARALHPALPAALDAILARMLAREPEDRYQTARELILALGAPRPGRQVPSFAEPEALSEPCRQQSELAETAPTQISMEVPHPAPGPAVVAGLWYLRYRKRDGRLCKGRVTTLQIVERLQSGLLPAGAEAPG